MTTALTLFQAFWNVLETTGPSWIVFPWSPNQGHYSSLVDIPFPLHVTFLPCLLILFSFMASGSLDKWFLTVNHVFKMGYEITLLAGPFGTSVPFPIVLQEVNVDFMCWLMRTFHSQTEAMANERILRRLQVLWLTPTLAYQRGGAHQCVTRRKCKIGAWFKVTLRSSVSSSLISLSTWKNTNLLLIVTLILMLLKI